MRIKNAFLDIKTRATFRNGQAFGFISVTSRSDNFLFATSYIIYRWKIQTLCQLLNLEFTLIVTVKGDEWVKLLDFDPERSLSFDVNRTLSFDPTRSLGFDPNRRDRFNVNRDLGFGKKGRVFRGYVCSGCESPVSPLDEKCSECGAVFASEASEENPENGGQNEKIGARFCTSCGRPLPSIDANCPRCGRRNEESTSRSVRHISSHTRRMGGDDAVGPRPRRVKRASGNRSQTRRNEVVE